MGVIHLRSSPRASALASAAAAALLLGGCGIISFPDDAEVRVGPTLECVPYESPETVEEINTFIETQRSEPGFAGGDVGVSTTLVDGRSFWVFGDTLRPVVAPGPRMVRNSILVMGQGCAGVYRPADGLAAIPDRPDGVSYWPTTVDTSVDENGDNRVVVGLMRVRQFGPGMWDYEIVGGSAARFHVPAGGVPELLRVVDVGPDDPAVQTPLWSAASTLMDDGTLYLFGTATTGEPLVFGYSMRVARTHVDTLTDQSTWEYWDGAEWSTEAGDAVEMIEAEDGVSRSLSVFERDGSWYAVSKNLDFLGSDLTIWKAPAPQGPWTDTGPVADLPTDDTWMTYLAYAHPDLLPEDDTVVVSWSVNSVDPGVVQAQPEAYRPEFRRVPLP